MNIIEPSGRLTRWKMGFGKYELKSNARNDRATLMLINFLVYTQETPPNRQLAIEPGDIPDFVIKTEFIQQTDEQYR